MVNSRPRVAAKQFREMVCALLFPFVSTPGPGSVAEPSLDLIKTPIIAAVDADGHGEQIRALPAPDRHIGSGNQRAKLPTV